MSAPQSPVGVDRYGFPLGAKQPRPSAKRGASFLMIGGIAHVVAVFLPWYEGAGQRLNGMSTFQTKQGDLLEAPGRIWILFGVILFGIGLTTYFFGRFLSLAIIATVVSVIGLITALLGVGAAQSMHDINGIGDTQSGAYIGILSILIALAGSIQVLSRRRAT